jgi:hypothetical protein
VGAGKGTARLPSRAGYSAARSLGCHSASLWVGAPDRRPTDARAKFRHSRRRGAPLARGRAARWRKAKSALIRLKRPARREDQGGMHRGSIATLRVGLHHEECPLLLGIDLRDSGRSKPSPVGLSGGAEPAPLGSWLAASETSSSVTLRRSRGPRNSYVKASGAVPRITSFLL